jgi:predicted N-acetyltransferase YhbS
VIRVPPYPMPVLRVARLAVDTSARKRGIGRALVRFCIELAERLREDYVCTTSDD